ncbi:MAG: polysaccharide deacetylase family protein [Bacteroidales bacterium]|nr:polysaccharide deacetylase family protein [Bacteroidales bacterium]
MINLSPPKFLQRFFPRIIWSFPNEERGVFITFDDGPIPEVTPWVLDLLAQYNAKATFFCLAKNVERYPEIFHRIVAEGHAVGNHSYSHIKGWFTPTKQYVEDVDYANTYLNTNLFRPPYGRFTPKQIRLLRQRYHVVLWSILSMDYSRYIPEHRVAQYVMNHIKPGEIVVFHDSIKAQRNLRHALPFVLEAIAMRGYVAKPITIAK